MIETRRFGDISASQQYYLQAVETVKFNHVCIRHLESGNNSTSVAIVMKRDCLTEAST